MNTENSLRRNHSTWMYAPYTLAIWVAQYAYVPYLVPYLETMDASLTMTGYVLASYGLFQMLLRIPIGILADRAGRLKGFITAGTVLLVLSTGVLVFATSPVMVLAGRSLSGFSSAFWICFIALYQSRYTGAQKVKASSMITAVSSLGKALGILIATVIVAAAPVRGVFVACCISASVALLLNFTIRESRAEKPAFSAAELKRLLSNRMLVSCSAVVALDQMVVFSTVYSYASSIVEKTAGPGFVGIAAFAAILGMGVFPMVSSAFLLRRWPAKTLLVTYFAVFALYLALLPFLPHPWLTLLVSFLGGAASAGLYAILMGLSVSTVDEKYRTLAMGVFQTAVAVGMTFGPPLFSAVMEATSITIGFVAGTLLLGASAALSVIWIPKTEFS